MTAKRVTFALVMAMVSAAWAAASLLGCTPSAELSGAGVSLSAADVVVPPTLSPEHRPDDYDPPRTKVSWDLAGHQASDGSPLTGFLLYEQSRLHLGGEVPVAGCLEIRTPRRGSALMLEVAQARSLAAVTSSDGAAEGGAGNVQVLDRALRDAAVGSPVIGEKTTEFELDFIWTPADPNSAEPLTVSRVEVRSRVRPGLSLYGGPGL
ncbi:MAG: hypothetical protein GF320_08905 [Armatimonadia bacterium]|nr:hypothetical protein [Armatimonadia bacterium]